MSAATPAWDSHRPPVPGFAGTCAARRVWRGPEHRQGCPCQSPWRSAPFAVAAFARATGVAGHAAIRPPGRGRRSGVATAAPRPARSWWNCCSAGWCGSSSPPKMQGPVHRRAPGWRQRPGRAGRCRPWRAPLQQPTGQCFAARSTQPWRGQSPVAAALRSPRFHRAPSLLAPENARSMPPRRGCCPRCRGARRHRRPPRRPGTPWE